MFSEEFHQGAHMRCGKSGIRRRDLTGKSSSKGGMILVLALGVLVLMSLLAIFFYTLTRAEKVISIDEVNLTRAELLAQTGLEIVKSQLRRPPEKVRWSSQINIDPAFFLPSADLDSSTALLFRWLDRHPGTPFFINWTRIVTPGFFSVTSGQKDIYTLKTGSSMPAFLQAKFSDGEPFIDSGYEDPVTHKIVGAGDGKFSFYDANHNGVHDMNETIHEPFPPEFDLNHNGMHDSYAGAVKFSIDDVQGTYSLDVIDTTGLIYINDGILTSDQKNWLMERYRGNKAWWVDKLEPELEKRHSLHLVKILDNLGVILGMFTPDETYKKVYQDDTSYGLWKEMSIVSGNPKAVKVVPTEQGLGYLLIYGSPNQNPVQGRLAGGYTSKRDIRGTLDQINQLKASEGRDLMQEDQMALFLEMVTTVAWVDKATVVGARFLYPEEQQDLFGMSTGDPEYNYYIKINEAPDNDKVAIIKGLNPAGVLVPGRAQSDAKPRYVKGHDRVLAIPSATFDPMIPLSSPYFVDKQVVGGVVQNVEVRPYQLIKGFDKDDDLDHVMGYLYEPRAPININSAPQPVIEACLTYLEANYVTDREGNLYPNGRGYMTDPLHDPHRIIDPRKGASIIVGCPAYNFYYDDDWYPWDWQEKDGVQGLTAHYHRFKDEMDCWGGKHPYMYGGLYHVGGSNVYYGAASAGGESINSLIERVNPTIHGTPSVVILPDEARAVAAAIIEYRNGGDGIIAGGDRNNNGILDFGDDADGDGLLRRGIEWVPASPADNFYKGGPFQCWEQFWVFLNMQKHRLFGAPMQAPGVWPAIINYGIPYRHYPEGTNISGTSRESHSRVENLTNLKVDLIFANANPNTDLMDFNPNASWVSLNRVDSKGYYLRRNVTRFDLFDVDGNPTHTTEFCFQPTGIYQIKSTGRVIGADGTLLAERQILSAVKFFDTARLTSQKDFEMGPNPQQYDVNNPLTHDDYFFNTNIAQKRDLGNGEDRNQTMTLPEAEWKATGLDGDPRKAGWQANVAGYDGQITLAPTFTSDTEMEGLQAGPALRAYARFSAGQGFSGDYLGGSFADTAESSHTQDEFNLRLCMGTGPVTWVRAQYHFRGDDTWDSWNQFIRLSPYEYDYVNHRVYTSFDRNRNGQLDWATGGSGDGIIYKHNAEEPTNMVIIRPLLEPEQYPLVNDYETLHARWSYAGMAEYDVTDMRVWPFSYSGGYYMARYNNLMLYPQTIPRYEREANLVPDGFLKPGARRIYYDLNVYTTPFIADWPSVAFLPQYTDNEKTAALAFADALFVERTSGSNYLSYLVEMWVKPMWSNTTNDNSVQDGNWEDFFKCRYNWQFGPYTAKDGSRGSTGFQTQDQYNRFLRIYFSGVGNEDTGSLLDVKFFLHPLQWLYTNYTMTNNNLYAGNGVGWFKQRALFFDCYTAALRGGGVGQSTMYYKVPFADPNELHPREIWRDPATFDYYRPEFRDGEWTHLAIVILERQAIYYINGVQARSWTIPVDKTFLNYGIERIELPDFPCTVGEIKVYTEVGNEAMARNQMLMDFGAGRYYDSGTYISPLLHLPRGAKMQGVSWTEFFPKTLDPNGTHITVKLLNGQGGVVRELHGGINTELINTPMSDFRIKIEMEAQAKPVQGQPYCLVDTPVVDDISIYYNIQEEVLLWELVE